jgi:2'-5' RNA ligase
MRCFIAIDVDDHLKESILQIQKNILNLGVDVKMVEPQNLHFTINFLGELDENKISNVKKQLDYVKGACEFEVNVAGLGYFGRENNIRTLWLGLKDGGRELSDLMSDVNGCVKIGEKCTKPHLTIGRVRGGSSKKDLLDFIKNHLDVNIGEMNVKYVKLKGSELGASGPIYSDLHTVRLVSNE